MVHPPHPYCFRYALLVAVAVFACGCQGPDVMVPGSGSGPLFRQLPDLEPTIRVRLTASTRQIAVRHPGGMWIAPSGPHWQQMRRPFPGSTTISRQDNRFIIVAANGEQMAWTAVDLLIVGASEQPMQVDGTPYVPTIVLHATASHQFDVVNHVKMEVYLPGVLDGELYKSWHATTFRAQAIAARGYALYAVLKWRQRHYDLVAGTASQMYRGAAVSPHATAAVHATAGMVLTYQNALFPGYYSSCCGGRGQSAHLAFRDGPDIEPLRGSQCGGWCQKSAKYRWGPLQRSTAEIAARLSAWGQANRHPVAALDSIREIRITQRNGVGRPGQFTIMDGAGRAYTMGPEPFRFACNFPAPGFAAPADHLKLWSSDVTPQVRGAVIVFSEGRGFGHGAGMCQWGAEALAQHGYNEFSILQLYYPGARVTRIY